MDMTVPAFQTAALYELREELGRGDVPLGEIQAFARRALEICRRYPGELPEEALRPLVREFPDLSRAFVAVLKRAEADKAGDEIEALRSKLNG